MFKIFGDSGFDIAFVSVLSFFSLNWIISVIIKNVSIVDIIWGLGYAIQLFCFYFTHTYNDFNLVLLILVSFHGLRLAIYIGIRNIGKEEDYRYQNFRRKYGGKQYWWVSFFQVFLLQGVINLAVCTLFGLFIRYSSFDIYNDDINNRNISSPNIVLCIIGGIVMHIGTLFESISDFQLALFKSKQENKGKLLTYGLWSLCRHPNYFGETLFWWGGYIYVCSVGLYWTIYCPIIMTLLIIFVSGVAMLENDESRKQKYQDQIDYFNKTAKFIPFIW